MQDNVALLNSKQVLHERADVLPFFKQHHDLSQPFCYYFPNFINPDCLAHEYEIYGDFVADLIVGDTSAQNYLLIEFENGESNSVFRQKANKATPEWAPRFEGAYSQLVDRLCKLEDMRSTTGFLNTLRSDPATFQGLIVIGEDTDPCSSRAGST